MKKMINRKRGLCPGDIKVFEGGLKAFESEMNTFLNRAANAPSEGDIAMQLDRSGFSTGLLPGSRVA